MQGELHPIKGEAFQHVELGRGVRVPDTAEQREWVYNLAESVKSQADLLIAR